MTKINGLLRYFSVGFKWRHFSIVISFLFIVSFMNSNEKINKKYGYSEFFLNGVSGPLGNLDLLSGVLWGMLIFSLLYFISRNDEEYFSTKSDYIFSRVSKIDWFISRIIFLIKVSLIHTCIMVLIFLITGLLFVDQSISSDIEFLTISQLFLVIIIFFTTNIIIALLYSNLSLCLENKIALTITIIVCFLPWLLELNYITMFLPGATSLFHFYGFTDGVNKIFSLPSAFFIIICQLVILISIGLILTIKKDIMGLKEDA